MWTRATRRTSIWLRQTAVRSKLRQGRIVALAQSRRRGELPARSISRVRTGRALHVLASAETGSALPAESLRHLSDRSAERRVDSDRQQHAEGDWRHRLWHRAASARSGNGVGVSDGRHRRYGHARVSTGGRRYTGRATRARRGLGRIAGCRASMRGSPSSARHFAPTTAIPPEFISAPPAARCG